jgi:hypothetical protein
MKLNHRILLASIFVALPLGLFSQTDTTYWTVKIKTGATLNQASFSDNWKSGGTPSLSINSMFNGKADYQKGRFDWISAADLQYGTVKNKGQGVRKSADKISLDTKVGYSLRENWNLFSSLNFLSQFDEGYEYPEDLSVDPLKISDFFAPAYITSSWGIEFKPNNNFYARVSPFSPRITIVRDTLLYLNVPENYGVEPGEKIRYEWKAFKIAANYEKDIVENISIKADYELFANLEGLQADNIDHRLDIFISAKVYKFLNLTLTNNYIYDLDQDKKLQSSLLIGASILFNYSNRP